MVWCGAYLTAGEFPVLKPSSKRVVSQPDEIITYLKETVRANIVLWNCSSIFSLPCPLPLSPALQGFNLDSSLKEPDLAEVTAYSAMLTDRLLPALVSGHTPSQHHL